VLSVNDPTAVHAVADGHDTPPRTLLVAPAGLGVVWIVQLVPFQASANVAVAAAPLVNDPTAVQTVADGHDTPLSWLPVAPAGFGVLWTAQLLPFQASARTWLPLLSEKLPAAVHALADAHDTPLSWLVLAPVTLGVLCCSQLAAAGSAVTSAADTTTAPTNANRLIADPPIN
jgi:hypothetical protein